MMKTIRSLVVLLSFASLQLSCSVVDATEELEAFTCDKKGKRINKKYKPNEIFTICVLPKSRNVGVVGFTDVTCKNRRKRGRTVATPFFEQTLIQGGGTHVGTKIINHLEKDYRAMAFQSKVDSKYFDEGSVPYLEFTGEILYRKMHKLPSCRKLREDVSRSLTQGAVYNYPKASFTAIIDIDMETDRKKQTQPPTEATSVMGTSSTTKDGLLENNQDSDDTDIVFCPDDIKLLHMDGVTPYRSSKMYSPFRILSQDKSTVTVELSQTWHKGELDKIFYEFREDTFDLICFETERVGYQSVVDTITITCNKNSPIAYAKVCLQDTTGTYLDAEEDKGIVPKCCHSDSPEGTPTVCYNLEIQCESTCEQSNTRARYLRFG